MLLVEFNEGGERFSLRVDYCEGSLLNLEIARLLIQLDFDCFWFVTYYDFLISDL